MSGKSENVKKGRRAEKIVKEYLLHKGLEFVKSNFRSRSGEIDLIFKDKENIIFVEVKLENEQYPARERINFLKKRHIIKTIEYFLYLNPQFSYFQPRIDLAIVKKNGNIEYIKGVY
jgi:putative endonuclease